MTPLQKKVKEDLEKLKKVESSETASMLIIKFGDRYNSFIDSYDTTEVAYLLSKFPPCKMFKHADSCTGYYPTDKLQKKVKHKVEVTEVNPIRLDCEGLDSYVHTLKWFTKIKEHFFKVEVIINYGSDFVEITYKFNDSRSLPKYSKFKANPIAGLKAIMYYGDSGEYMTKFKCEVLDINDKDFFVQ